MQRYWDAETTSKEEWELAQYVARADDPEFDELRGVLGYLSIGKEKKARRAGPKQVKNSMSVTHMGRKPPTISRLWHQSRHPLPISSAAVLLPKLTYSKCSSDEKVIDVHNGLAPVFWGGFCPAGAELLSRLQGEDCSYKTDGNHGSSRRKHGHL